MSQRHSTLTDLLSVLRLRLGSVVDALATLQHTPIESEVLHDARVACRRAEAALRIGRDLLPDRQVAWLRTHLRRLRRACNSARDIDVLREWLAAQRRSPVVRKLRKKLKHKRRVDQSQIVELTKSLIRKRRFATHANRAIQTDHDRSHAESWHSFVARRLLDEFTNLLGALPTDADHPGQLHRLRIAGKRLRYACEFVSEVVPAAQFDSLQELLKQMQDRLGQLHDTVVRLECLRHQAKHATGKKLRRDSADERDRLTEEWRDWWSSTSPDAAIGSAAAKMPKLILRP